MENWLFLLVFNLVVAGLLALDLGVFNRKAHAISIKEAILWSVFWISLSLLFNLGIYSYRGSKAGVEFLTGYILELALSVDNLFVFVILFRYFKVPAAMQHRVLFWGILGAVLMRGAFIWIGGELIEMFHGILYFFGAFLVYTGIKLMLHKDDEEPDMEHNRVLLFLRRHIPVTSQYDGTRFLVREAGRWVATPLFVVLCMVETTDVIFATDSVPAIFTVTHDRLIVYTSNICAILGLRSLYFLLAGGLMKFQYLQTGISIVLVFIGAKMLAELAGEQYKIKPVWSLAVVGILIGGSIAASFLFPQKEKPETS